MFLAVIISALDAASGLTVNFNLLLNQLLAASTGCWQNINATISSIVSSHVCLTIIICILHCNNNNDDDFKSSARDFFIFNVLLLVAITFIPDVNPL